MILLPAGLWLRGRDPEKPASECSRDGKPDTAPGRHLGRAAAPLGLTDEIVDVFASGE
jgi:hypothetical protein